MLSIFDDRIIANEFNSFPETDYHRLNYNRLT